MKPGKKERRKAAQGGRLGGCDGRQAIQWRKGVAARKVQVEKEREAAQREAIANRKLVVFQSADEKSVDLERVLEKAHSHSGTSRVCG